MKHTQQKPPQKNKLGYERILPAEELDDNHDDIELIIQGKIGVEHD
jgi:hypothetical protein